MRRRIMWGSRPISAAAALFMTTLFTATLPVACTEPEPESALSNDIGRTSQALLLDPDFENPNDPRDRAEPARDYTLFEADPVRPIAVLQNSELVAVTNTVDDQLELLRATRGGVRRCGRIKVGMRPVAVAAVHDGARAAELWVVNHLSDSVSRVRVDARTCGGEIVDTLHVGDEPRDIVVTRGSHGRRLVFVATAHRGQHHPVSGARSGADLVTPAGEKQDRGLADVFVFDADGDRQPLEIVNLFTDKPRALAVGDGVVYAAGYQTGNRTSVVLAEVALARGLTSLRSILSSATPSSTTPARPSTGEEPAVLAPEAMRDPYYLGRSYEGEGAWLERRELELPESVRGVARIEGGLPAVSGRGRCMPDPRPELTSRFEQQVCVQVDDENRVQGIVVQRPGEVHPECQCTSGDGTLQPTTSLIVRFFDSEQECGSAFTRFPDGSAGCWLDAAPGGTRTPADERRQQPVPMAWNDEVRFSLPDQDVFAIDTRTLRVRRAFSGVGTIIFGLAVQPGTGRLVASNTEAMNLTRFEGPGASSSTTVRGHLHESRLTLIDGRSVLPVHLNTHIDYGECCERRPGENEQSLAFPTSVAFSSSGERLYLTALGSDKVAVLESRALGERFDNTRARRRGQLHDVTLGSEAAPAGPVGLALDERRGRVYVKTHFSNELVVLDAAHADVLSRVRFESPEPESIRRGRHVLYDARLTSSHGDSACASCHVFGDFDGLSWDLGDPDGVTVQNPGPFAVSPDAFALTGITRDIFRSDATAKLLVADFRSNKGPMATQTLRGLANHGAQHWRGDRTRRFQDEPGRHPNFGSLNEDNSFGEFDVAIEGLNGNDAPLSPELMQDFTNFALQLTLPPNPVRALDDSLDGTQASARAQYFGCAELSDADLERGECIAPGGARVDIDTETRACACAQNPLVRALGELPRVREVALTLQAVLADAALRGQLTQSAGEPGALPAEPAARFAAVAGELSLRMTELAGVELNIGERGLLDAAASSAISGLSGALLELVELSTAHGVDNAASVLEQLSAAAERLEPKTAETLSPEALEAALPQARELAELNAHALRDEAARGTGAFRNLLGGCDVRAPVSCGLRVSDTIMTCHGCHTLDRDGNAEFDVYRPGFFGTSGAYSFENVSQVFKVPHLRNLYQKAGMFGMPPSLLTVPESVLGARSGGFSAAQHRFMGPQVRGFGYFHDGSFDTLHRFFGFTVFVARPPATVNARDTGNPGGFSAATPSADRRAECVARLRRAPESVVEGLPPALSLCLGGSPVPEICFLDPAAPACEQALVALSNALGDPSFPAVFRSQILPACWQLGSFIEGGGPDGACYPNGQRERAAMESFMLAFDSNLKPMVGQQVTVRGRPRPSRTSLLRSLLGAAARGHCDAAARRDNRGYLVVEPRAHAPGATLMLDDRGRTHRLDQLWDSRSPITFTCYPPQPQRAEARRAAFDEPSKRRH